MLKTKDNFKLLKKSLFLFCFLLRNNAAKLLKTMLQIKWFYDKIYDAIPIKSGKNLTLKYLFSFSKQEIFDIACILFKKYIYKLKKVKYKLKIVY